MPPRARRLAFFFWEGHLGIAPSLINGVRLLAAAGYEIDVITRATVRDYAPVPTFAGGVRVVGAGGPPAARAARRPRMLAAAAWRVLGATPEPLRRPLRRLVRHAETLAGLPGYLARGSRVTRDREYACFVGVDPLGLIVAAAIGDRRHVPVVYWSLELAPPPSWADPVARLVKHLERRAHGHAALTIVQDAGRAARLRAHNQVAAARVVLVPNAPLGPPVRTPSRFLHTRLGLPADRRLLLHVGMLAPAALSLELARAAASWPPDWTLVLHASVAHDHRDAYVRRILRAGRGRLRLSLEPVPYDHLDRVVASGHVGLAVYRSDLGPDFVSAGASGKLAHYLRCGLPVVCSDFPGAAELVARYECGACVTDPGEIAPAVERILADYPRQSRNAVRCYEEALEFGAHFRGALAEIERLRDQVSGMASG